MNKENFDQFSEMMKAFTPRVSTNKNGYEIRTKILEMAKNNVWEDYHSRWGAYQTTVERQGDEMVTTVTMPEIPGVQDVLETAERFYAFVNQK